MSDAGSVTGRASRLLLRLKYPVGSGSGVFFGSGDSGSAFLTTADYHLQLKTGYSLGVPDCADLFALDMLEIPVLACS